MNRRELLLATGGLLGTKLVWAQSGKAPYRIGLLVSADATGWFVAAMKDRGWVEGRDYLMLRSGTPFAADKAAAAAKQIIDQRPDLIIAGPTAFGLAAHRLTSTIPIVMWVSGYPVEAGLANSLQRPGKNVTGNSMYAGMGLWGKMVQILKEAKPATKRVGVLWTYAPPAFLREEIDPGQKEIRNAASVLGLSSLLAETSKPEDVLASIAQLARDNADALIIAGRTALGAYREKAIELCIAKRLPVIVDVRWPVNEEPYPLFAFGAVLDDLMRQTAAYVVQILKGARAGDLPIQQPTKVELVVNLKFAQAIRLPIPQSILLRADRVIE